MQFLESQQAQISIDTSRYEKSLREQLEKIVDFSEREVERISTFKIDLPKIRQTLVKYPMLAPEVEKSIASKDPNKLAKTAGRVFDFYLKNKEYFDLRAVTKALWDYETLLKGNQQNFTKESAEQTFVKFVQETKQHMETLELNIREAIKRLGKWSYPITIQVNELYKDQDMGPSNSAFIEIHCGNDTNPSFMYYLENGKGVIDDVIDAGDQDFFHDLQSQKEYFDLIKELQSPGSSSKGQPIVLYTARPKADRKRYIDATTVPTNIFLTSNPDSASGIGQDFGGRDIWKLKIDTKYLQQTLDTPQEKQYQVVGPAETPVIWIKPWGLLD